MFLVLQVVGQPADDAATEDNPRLPRWFREMAKVVLTDSKRAKETAEAKRKAARDAGDPVNEAYAELMLGHAARRQNDIPGALGHSRDALASAEKQKDSLLLFNACYGHALNLRAAGDHASAIDYLLRSLRMADDKLSPNAQSTAAAAIGASYHSLGDLTRASEYTQRALAYSEQRENRPAIAMYAHNLASISESMGDLAAARKGYMRSLAIKRELGNRTDIADLEQQLAMLDFAEGRAEEAFTALQPILAQRRTLRGKVKLTGTLRCLSEVCLKLGRREEAFGHIEEARGYAEAIDSPELRAGVYRQLAAVQEARGDFPAALAAARLEFKQRELIAGRAALQRTAELQAQYDFVRKDQELVRLSRENEIQAAAAQARAAQLAQTASDLRVKEADLRAVNAELSRIRLARLAYAASALTVVVVLGAVVVVQRTRLRAERKTSADTRAARDAAENAAALQSRLLVFASHDLKAPLATLNSAAQLIEEASGQPEMVAALAGSMRTETVRMIQLVHDFIDHAALDVGRLELRLAEVDLRQVIAQVAGDYRTRADQKRQIFSVEAPVSPVPPVRGEAVRIGQVLGNLVSNAIKYTPARGRITIASGHDHTGVWCEVRDSGPGLSAEDQARLFQPFMRLSARPTSGESSSGLGLYLAHELVRLHGGTLTVRSAPGEGASFRMTLPPA